MKEETKQAGKKRRSSNRWMSVTSLIISFLAFGVACMCYLKTDIPSEGTLISILVSLLALCVTFVLGFQIVNTLDIKENISYIKELEQKLELNQEGVVNFRHTIWADHYSALGLIYLDKKYYKTGLYYLLKGLYHALHSDNEGYVNSNIEHIDKIIAGWGNGADESNSHLFGKKSFKTNITGLLDDIDNDCRETRLYKDLECKIPGLRGKLNKII